LMRKPVIAANWKMHKTIKEAENFAAEFPYEPDLCEQVDVVIFPPYTALFAVSEALKGTGIKLGAQNMHPDEKGAFTGEISPLMLKDAGCSCVILGHSERRHIFSESDEYINRKVKAAFRHGLKPFLCVGETLDERQAGLTQEVCKRQLSGSLAGLNADEIAAMVIAYEPVWAIGTGVNATSEDAEKSIAFIRGYLGEKYGAEAAGQVRIQYGGSVKPSNIGEYIRCENIDGALVGGASLEIDSFYSLVQGALQLAVYA